MRCIRWFIMAATVPVLLGVTVMPARATLAYPNSMASVGDSITRAYDIGWCCILSDSPQYSWSTGYSTSVNSQYRRLLALNPTISGHEYNDARTGAKMANLDSQVKTAAGQAVNYLTVLMGANDLCTSSIATMTPTATFQAQVQQALTDFFATDSNGHVYLSSLPNIYQLWSVLHTNALARSTWASFKICQSMLNANNTEAQRQQVVAQEVADNNVLATVCAQFTNCRWDGLAAYNTQFPAGDVSTVDYFHPNIQGQNLVASVSWSAGYWGS